MENNNITIQQKQAYDLIANTYTSFFLTGKAGSGKTTFLRRVQNEIKKNFVVLAPTGVAAILAGGQTIHSFFGFPLEALPLGSVGKINQERYYEIVFTQLHLLEVNKLYSLVICFSWNLYSSVKRKKRLYLTTIIQTSLSSSRLKSSTACVCRLLNSRRYIDRMMKFSLAYLIIFETV